MAFMLVKIIVLDFFSMEVVISYPSISQCEEIKRYVSPPYGNMKTFCFEATSKN